MTETPKQSSESITSTTTSPSRYSKATHLTEFYPYLNGSIQSSHHAPSLDESNSVKPIHDRKQSLSTINSYTSFTPSTMDFRRLVTKTDISQTTEAYNDILTSAEQYRRAILTVAEAAGNFGAALENGAKCKGAGSAADGLQSASGLFFLVANHEQILSHSIKEIFEEPVSKEINKFKLKTAQNDETFKVNIKERVKDLKLQERENAKLSRSKTRNLVTYRSKLQKLTSQIDQIDNLKKDYYQSSFDLVQETSNNILTQVGSIVRAQVEIYEGIARKGWSGGGLDELIAQCPDPFTQDEVADDEYQNDNDHMMNSTDTDTLNATTKFNNKHNNDNDNDTIDLQKQEHPQLQEPFDLQLPHQSKPLNEHQSLHLQQPALKTTHQGLSLNRSAMAIKPVLSHKQSLQSLETAHMASSTPIKSKQTSFKDLSIQNNDTGSELPAAHEDNSFSLPLPGSSRSGNSNGKLSADNSKNEIENSENTTNGDENNNEVKNLESNHKQDSDDDNDVDEEEEEVNTKDMLDELPVTNEWNDQ